MKNCILFLALVSTLSSCAITQKTADIEYHHSKYSSNSTIPITDESTLPIIHNDNELVLSDTNSYDQDTEVIVPKVHNGEYLVTELNTLSIDNQEDNKQILEPKPAAKPLKVKIEEKQIKHIALETADYIKPVDGHIITKFGDKTEYGTNKGINISADEGTPIVSSTNGKVIYADFDATFGNLVIIKSGDSNTVISYAHLKDLSVSKGVHLKQGESLGFIGMTGKVKEPQLHFAIREGKKAVDPLKYINY